MRPASSYFGATAMILLLVGAAISVWYLSGEESAPPLARHSVIPSPPQASSPPSSPVAASAPVVEPPRPVPANDGVVEGAAVNATTGQPVADFDMWVTPVDANGNGAFAGSPALHFSDANGRFVLRALARSTRYRIAAKSPGYAKNDVDFATSADGQPVTDIIIQLAPGMRMDGQVVDDTGSPVPKSSVYVDRDPRGDPDAVTDARGQFTLVDVSPDAKVLWADHAEYAPGKAAIEPGGKTRIEIVLESAGDVEGIVHRGNQPVPAKISIHLANAHQYVTHTATTDSAGHFSFKTLPVGTATIGVSPKEMASEEPVWINREVLVGRGQTTVVDFDLTSFSSSIEGLVQIDGRPAGEREASVSIEIAGAIGNQTMTVPTGPDGFYRANPILAGQANVSVSVQKGEQAARRKTESLAVPEGRAVRQDFSFAAAGRIRGHVAGMLPTDSGLACLVAGNVGGSLNTLEDIIALQTSSSVFEDAVLGADGLFEFSDLEPGSYTVITAAGPAASPESDDYIPNFRVNSKTVNLGAGGDLKVEIMLK